MDIYITIHTQRNGYRTQQLAHTGALKSSVLLEDELCIFFF
jgi:hypothetical protein